MPPVWQYLAERQQNSFMPTIAVIDVVGGYHLPATEYGAPPVRRAVLMAALAATLVNDLYSASKEQGGAHYDYNLPTLIAVEERCSPGEAVGRAAALHDELVRTYEREAGSAGRCGFSATGPVPGRGVGLARRQPRMAPHHGALHGDPRRQLTS